MEILDVNNKKIKVGDTVNSKQYPGGVFPPAKGETGAVEIHKDFGPVIRYRKKNFEWDSFIRLEGQINEIL